MLPLLAVGICLLGAASVGAQTVPWQQPPMSAEFQAWASQSGRPAGTAPLPAVGGVCGDACEMDAVATAGCNGGACPAIAAPGRCCVPWPFHDPWVRAEALLWWTKSAGIPPLLTTSPDNTPQAQAGVLGQPGTVVLVGDQELNGDFRAGGRIAVGTWLDACDNVGLEFVYLGLGQSTQRFDRSSTGSPILARPFFDVDRGVENSRLLAYPNVVQGDFSCSATNSFQAAEALLRWAIVRCPGYRIELLGGYRFQRLTDALDIADSSNTAAPGATIQVFDQFHTRNDFHGGELGIAGAWHRCRWSLEGTAKLALGNTHSQIDIDGSTTTAAGTFAGGMLALPSNMGRYGADQFSVVPEIGATLGYDLTCRLRMTAGYTFIYWNHVSRPGDQIDPNLSPSQFPPTTQTATRPAFERRTTDFWAQGINLGLDYRF
jgi:hypothetical protein